MGRTPDAIVETYAMKRNIVERTYFTGAEALDQARRFAESQGQVVLSGRVYRPGGGFDEALTALFVPEGELEDMRFAQPDVDDVARGGLSFSLGSWLCLVKLHEEIEDERYGDRHLDDLLREDDERRETELEDRMSNQDLDALADAVAKRLLKRS